MDSIDSAGYLGPSRTNGRGRIRCISRNGSPNAIEISWHCGVRGARQSPFPHYSRSANSAENRAAAAARRLDDTFRNYLAERGTKPFPLTDLTPLVTGVAALRIAADAVVDLWQRDDGTAARDRSAERGEIVRTSNAVESWYYDLAASLIGRREFPEPLTRDGAAEGRLVDALRRDVRDEGGGATATTIRMFWTGDHLDRVRRLQSVIIQPARAADERGRRASTARSEA